MKSKFVVIIFSAILFCITSCGGRSAKNQDSHDHENCTDHDHSHVTPNQEGFKVEADSSAVEADTVKRVHNHAHEGHDHSH